jgi:hypothetical protein
MQTAPQEYEVPPPASKVSGEATPAQTGPKEYAVPPATGWGLQPAEKPAMEATPLQTGPEEYEVPPATGGGPRPTEKLAAVEAAPRQKRPQEYEVPPATTGGASAWPGLTEDELQEAGRSEEALQERSKRSFQQFRSAARGGLWLWQLPLALSSTSARGHTKPAYWVLTP